MIEHDATNDNRKQACNQQTNKQNKTTSKHTQARAITNKQTTKRKEAKATKQVSNNGKRAKNETLEIVHILYKNWPTPFAYAVAYATPYASLRCAYANKVFNHLC